MLVGSNFVVDSLRLLVLDRQVVVGMWTLCCCFASIFCEITV